MPDLSFFSLSKQLSLPPFCAALTLRFCGEFGTDDVTLSDEHFEYGFYTLEEILKMDNISKPYKRAIKKCITGDTTAPRLKIKITGHASVFQSAGPR